MSLFKNQSFVLLLSKQLGIEGQIEPEASALIQALVENQTRKLMQNAIKFMSNQKRQQLNLQDLQFALKIMGLRDIHLISQQDHYHRQQNGILRVDQINTNVQQFIIDQLKGINHLFQYPQINARWVYLNETIPNTRQNKHIKNLKQINELRSKQQQQRNKKFNIIKDTPLSLLSTQEVQFFKNLTQKLLQGIVPDVESTNLSRLFPFILQYILDSKISDHFLLFLLQIIKNQYVQNNLDNYLHQILAYLSGYQGKYCWEVGIDIANLVLKWRQKYPNINQLILKKSFQSDLYSEKIKCLALQIILGIDLDINSPNIQQDVQNNIPYANLFLNLINKCVLNYNYQSKYHKSLPQGMAKFSSKDCYLQMNL